MSMEERAAFERNMAYQMASTLPPEVHKLWASCRHTTRNHVQTHTIFVLWQSFLDEPSIVGSIHVSDAAIDFSSGLGVKLKITYMGSTRQVWVAHCPADILGDGRVFSHIPFKADLSYVPRKGYAARENDFVLKVPIVFRTQGNPTDLRDGELQVTPIGAFRQAYPQFTEIRL
jgi:hypothetical protein